MDNEVLKKEEDFHDQWAASVNIDEVAVVEFFEACTAPENRLIMKKLGDLTGKKILEVGAGLGEASVYFAKKGAEVTASDISNGMLNVSQRLAEKFGVKIEIKQCSADNLDFPDDSFDFVYEANTLHHVNLEAALIEAKRVLKPGGILVSWDPLAHNPLINIYRKMASGVRTTDEQPLRMKDLTVFKKYFSQVDYQTTWFLTLWIFLKFYLIDKVDPNKERYWKKILFDYKKLEKVYNFLEKIDHFILTLFPFLKRYCWNIVIFSKK